MYVFNKLIFYLDTSKSSTFGCTERSTKVGSALGVKVTLGTGWLILFCTIECFIKTLLGGNNKQKNENCESRKKK
jgi:hypothetical protein